MSVDVWRACSFRTPAPGRRGVAPGGEVFLETGCPEVIRTGPHSLARCEVLEVDLEKADVGFRCGGRGGRECGVCRGVGGAGRAASGGVFDESCGFEACEFFGEIEGIVDGAGLVYEADFRGVEAGDDASVCCFGEVVVFEAGSSLDDEVFELGVELIDDCLEQGVMLFAYGPDGAGQVLVWAAHDGAGFDADHGERSGDIHRGDDDAD